MKFNTVFRIVYMDDGVNHVDVDTVRLAIRKTYRQSPWYKHESGVACLRRPTLVRTYTRADNSRERSVWMSFDQHLSAAQVHALGKYRDDFAKRLAKNLPSGVSCFRVGIEMFSEGIWSEA